MDIVVGCFVNVDGEGGKGFCFGGDKFVFYDFGVIFVSGCWSLFGDGIVLYLDVIYIIIGGIVVGVVDF